MQTAAATTHLPIALCIMHQWVGNIIHNIRITHLGLEVRLLFGTGNTEKLLVTLNYTIWFYLTDYS